MATAGYVSVGASLDDLDTTTRSVTMLSSDGVTTASTFIFTRTGKLVTMQLSTRQGNTSVSVPTTVTYPGVIPLGFRPSTATMMRYTVAIRSSGVTRGALLIDSNGDVRSVPLANNQAIVFTTQWQIIPITIQWLLA
jgi:hypothetical protein